MPSVFETLRTYCSGMTKYEIITTIIAMIALIQPWAIALYKKYIRKTQLNFIPSSKIKLYYNRSGAYINLGGVIEAKHQSALIRNISAKVVRKCDKAELCMDWSSFMIPVFQSIGGNPVTTNEIARPFKVEANGLCPVFIEFSNVDADYLHRLSEIYEDLLTKAKLITSYSIPYNEAKVQFKSSSEYQIFKEELLETFYWKISDYTIELRITYNTDNEELYYYKFSLDSTEITKFKENIEKTMDSTIDNMYGQLVSLFYPQKEFNSTDDFTM